MLISLFPIPQFPLNYCISFSFLSCSLLICIHRVLPFLKFGLSLECRVRSASRFRSRCFSPPKKTVAMRSCSIGRSWRWPIEAWLTGRSGWDGSVWDTSRSLVASLIDRWSLHVSLRSTISSRVCCPISSSSWWRTSRVRPMVPRFVPSLFRCLGSSKSTIFSPGRSHSW